jgi:hypothetical protein
MSLFKAAKEKTVEKKSKASARETIEINDDLQFHKDLTRLVKLNMEIETLGAEAAMLHEEAKNRGKKEFKGLYNASGKNPGSFMVQANAKDKPSVQYMFLPNDKYIKIADEERADYLRKTISPDVVEEKTEFKFNSEILDKYGDEISALIENSSLPEEAKSKLIEATTTWNIKKGTIENFKTDAKMAKIDIDILVEEVQPIFGVKTPRILN